MPPPITIDDPQDPRLGEYVGLRDPDGRRRREADEGFFVAEGITVLERLLASDLRVRSVLLLAKRYERLAPLFADLAAPVYLTDRSVMAAVTGFDLHRGVVASAERPRDVTWTELGEARLVVVAEGLNDPENLGAIARSARAFGAEALLLDPTCADPFARRTVRVSMGELLFLPTRRLTDWPNDIARIAAAGLTVAALTPAADDAIALSTASLERVALLVGAEGPGLTPAALSAAAVRIRIPISPSVDSLNVGHATAVALAHFAPFVR